VRFLDLPPRLSALGACQGLASQRYPAFLDSAPLPGNLSRLAQRSYGAADLAAAEEAFLTNSVLEVAPLVTLDGRPIGDGCPGPVTRQLQRAYRKEVLESRGLG